MPDSTILIEQRPGYRVITLRRYPCVLAEAPAGVYEPKVGVDWRGSFPCARPASQRVRPSAGPMAGSARQSRMP
jgi:hypothetical protein